MSIYALLDTMHTETTHTEEDHIAPFPPQQTANNKQQTTTGEWLYQRARCRIPGGTQLLSKRPEMFLPNGWPNYYSRAEGAYVWDLDGNRYLDMSLNGVGACVLGHADPDVNRAVHQAVDNGSMSTLNCPEEVELAELLCELHEWADMARFVRSGGEAVAVAVRIARARTKRDKIAFCGYHGWHDWYLSANLPEEEKRLRGLEETTTNASSSNNPANRNALAAHLLSGLDPAGVPGALAGLVLPFHYNALDELKALVQANRGEIAAIVMEPMRGQQPLPGFLEGVRQIADEIGAALVFDESTAGFRLNTGGIHLTLGVHPDMAVFAKAISNGYAFAAVLGREQWMQAAQTTFISSTYWTERIGPAAALATLHKHRALNVPAHLCAIGSQVQQGWKRTANAHGLQITVGGIPPLSTLRFDYPNGQAIRTLYTQMLLDRGFLAGGAFYVTYAHQTSDTDAYLAALDDVFGLLARAIRSQTVETQLRGPIAHADFQRLA